MNKPDVKKLILLNLPYVFAFYFADKIAAVFRLAPGAEFIDKLTNGFAVFRIQHLVRFVKENDKFRVPHCFFCFVFFLSFPLPGLDTRRRIRYTFPCRNASAFAEASSI